MYRIKETININTLLGIRFWDPLMDEQVRDGLKVTARPADAAWPVVEAYRTISDIYAFHKLPGISNDTCPECEKYPAISTSVQKSFIIEISDLRRRYIDAAFKVDLPLSTCGIYLSRIECSPYRVSPKGFLLYSSSTRGLPRWMMSVRAELWDISLLKPASHALMRITTHDGSVWYGLADDEGKIAVYVPPPTLQNGFRGSPASSHNKKSLLKRTWEISIEILYDGNLTSLPGSNLPEYKHILCQHQANIWNIPPSEGSPPSRRMNTLELSETLEYGKETILRTGHDPHLLISPVNYSP